jgi:hypothetical protein
MKNLKDLMTTIAGVLGFLSFVGGIIMGVLTQNAVAIPKVFIIVVGICGALAAGLLGYFSGKNPDGTTKTSTQVIELNKQAAETKEIKP